MSRSVQVFAFFVNNLMVATQNSPLAPVDPRIVRTRKSLRLAMVSVLEEKDFESITMQDIADRAKVNRGTVYTHYPDMYALLGDTIRHGFAEVLGKWMDFSAPIGPASPRQMLLAVCDFLAEISNKCQDRPRHRLCEPYLEAQVKGVLRELLLPWLAMRQKHIRGGGPKQDPELAATMMSWGIFAAAWEWLCRRQPAPTEEFADEAMEFILCQAGAKG